MKRLLFIFLFALALLGRQTYADTLITGTFGSSRTPTVTIGYAFSFSQDVLITDVGIYDSTGSGLTPTNMLGIWTDSGSLLASKSFDPTVSPVLDGHFRWLSLESPLHLYSNARYRVGTFGSEPGLLGSVAPLLAPDKRHIHCRGREREWLIYLSPIYHPAYFWHGIYRT